MIISPIRGGAGPFGSNPLRILNPFANSIIGGSTPAFTATNAIAIRLNANASRIGTGITNATLNFSRNATSAAVLDSASDILQELGGIATRALDGTLSAIDRDLLNTQAQQLQTELGNVLGNSSFNGTPILDGSTMSLNAGELQVSYTDADGAAVTAALGAIDLTTQAGAEAALVSIGDALGALTEQQVQVGTNSGQLERAVNVGRVQAANLSAAADRMAGFDPVAFAASQSMAENLQAAQIAVHKAHNVQQKSILKFLDAS